MDKSLPNSSFETIGSARQAASSALTSAFNSVVTQPVNTLKNNITSNSNSNTNALINENASPEFVFLSLLKKKKRINLKLK